MWSNKSISWNIIYIYNYIYDIRSSLLGFLPCFDWICIGFVQFPGQTVDVATSNASLHVTASTVCGAHVPCTCTIHMSRNQQHWRNSSKNKNTCSILGKVVVSGTFG